MNKTTYIAPTAEMILLIPDKSIAAENGLAWEWLWGNYSTMPASLTAVDTPVEIWEGDKPWDFDGSY